MITDLTKNLIAVHYEDKITSVRLNESIIVDEFEASEVDKDTVIVEFNVPNEINQITRLEILNDEDVLSNSNLFVPVEADTRFKYTMRVG